MYDPEFLRFPRSNKGLLALRESFVALCHNAENKIIPALILNILNEQTALAVFSNNHPEQMIPYHDEWFPYPSILLERALFFSATNDEVESAVNFLLNADYLELKIVNECPFYRLNASLLQQKLIDMDIQSAPDFVNAFIASVPKVDPPKVRWEYVYLFSTPHGWYKIGVTSNVNTRLAQFQTLPFPVTCIHTIPSRTGFQLEKQLHATFAHKRINGEWFRLDAQDVTYIQSLVGGQ